LDGVLIVAHEEVDLVAIHASITGLNVGADLLESGADVRPTVGIVDRGGLVKTRCFGHGSRRPSSIGAPRAPLLLTRRPQTGHGFNCGPGRGWSGLHVNDRPRARGCRALVDFA